MSTLSQSVRLHPELDEKERNLRELGNYAMPCGGGLLPAWEHSEPAQEPAMSSDVAEQAAVYRQYLEKVFDGGVPVPMVVVHSHPNDCDNEVAFLPFGFSPYRYLAYLLGDREGDVAADFGCCMWCEQWADDGDPLRSLLVVTVGQTYHAYPTCDACRKRYDAETHGFGLDYFEPYAPEYRGLFPRIPRSA